MSPPIKNFLLILAAALLSAVVGGLFGAGIAALSPELVSNLFGPKTGSLVRYAAAVGAIWGVFIGAGAMVFGLAVAAIANWFRSHCK
ncbi:MAG: hypothetical protein WCB27_24355 [Thermoguttaceae bacterium]|jgi:hypothetical protein